MQIILDYFPELTSEQIHQFEQLEDLYKDWNQKINVISRKDIDNLYTRHVLHSLSIARMVSFLPDAEVLDLGTGGGFPGIPLAILFPETKFTLIDGTKKKIFVVNEVARAIQLKNITAKQVRAEELKAKYDFIVTRAVASLEKLLPWSYKLIKKQQKHAWPNGLIALKGGNIDEEIKAVPKHEYIDVMPITDIFEEDVFEEKYLVYVQL